MGWNSRHVSFGNPAVLDQHPLITWFWVFPSPSAASSQSHSVASFQFSAAVCHIYNILLKTTKKGKGCCKNRIYRPAASDLFNSFMVNSVLWVSLCRFLNLKVKECLETSSNCVHPHKKVIWCSLIVSAIIDKCPGSEWMQSSGFKFFVLLVFSARPARRLQPASLCVHPLPAL